MFIAVMGDNAKAAGLKLMHELRQEGVCVQMDIMGRKIKISLNMRTGYMQKRPL